MSCSEWEKYILGSTMHFSPKQANKKGHLSSIHVISIGSGKSKDLIMYSIENSSIKHFG